MKIYAPYLLNLLDYARYQQVKSTDLNKVLTHHNINIENLGEVISAKVYIDVFARIIEITKNDYTGLYFGNYLNMGALGLVKEISLHTSSIEQGVLILQNFLDTKFPLAFVKTIEDTENYILQLDSPIEETRLKKHILDMVMSIIYRELKLMLPSTFHPIIRLPYISNIPYDDILENTVVKHSTYQIVLPSEVLSVEINQSSVKKIELLLPKFIAMLGEDQSNYGKFSFQVRNMILNMCSPEIPNFEQVLQHFPYSKRTMQRKLMNEGKSYRSILNSIKQELSNYLIKEKHLRTMDVAFILGYSESSAYLHAVKSWRDC